MAKIKLEDLQFNGTTEVKDEVIVEPEVAEESVTEEFEAAQPAEIIKSDSSIQNVRKIRIYSVPSTKVPARTFTGNVEVIGTIDKFKIVKYVRAGFGLVKGYTLDL